MDELWQRYRSFWVPVLIGVGVFLIGLIVVHAMTDDPEIWRGRVGSAANDTRQQDPARKYGIVKRNAADFEANVRSWAARLDQAGTDKLIEYAISSSLQSAILRGLDPLVLRAAIAPSGEGASSAVVALFDGDEAAAAAAVGQALRRFGDDAVGASRALARYEETRLDRVSLLSTGDPNVGLARLLNDVWSELRVRANRADVDLRADVLGFERVTSVTRSELPMRVLNLALIAELVDLCIRSDVRAVEEIRLDQNPETEFGESFYREWPFTIVVSGETHSIRPILDRLTDPKHPVPVLKLTIEHAPRTTALEGLVQLRVEVASALVRPDASLNLETEDPQ